MATTEDTTLAIDIWPTSPVGIRLGRRSMRSPRLVFWIRGRMGLEVMLE